MVEKLVHCVGTGSPQTVSFAELHSIVTSCVKEFVKLNGHQIKGNQQGLEMLNILDAKLNGFNSMYKQGTFPVNNVLHFP